MADRRPDIPPQSIPPNFSRSRDEIIAKLIPTLFNKDPNELDIIFRKAMLGDALSISSQEEQQQMINGVDAVVLAEGENAKNANNEPEEEPEEDFPAGMKSGLKNLYNGKEDKRGRYNWQDTIPEDLGDPPENDTTAKWALLVRNVKVYGDPRRVLAIHSIVVQSPLLKKLLSRVLKNYPGVTVGLQRLEFSGKFEPLIHRWSNLNQCIDALGDETEEEKITKSHATLLQDVLMKEFQTLIDTSQDMKSKHVITYDLLWCLFEPGGTIFTRKDGQECAFILVDAKYGADSNGIPCFWLTCKYVDWDGTKYGTQNASHMIPMYTGTRPINKLRAFPIEYHHEPDALRARLIERGARAESLAGPNFKAYSGIGWKINRIGAQENYNINGRVRATACSI